MFCPYVFQNTSSRRLKCLEQLNDFLQAATAELMWLSEREEVEVTRDWVSKDLNLADLDEHHKVGSPDFVVRHDSCPLIHYLQGKLV